MSIRGSFSEAVRKVAVQRFPADRTSGRWWRPSRVEGPAEKRAITAAAKLLDLTDLQVRTAVSYYGAYPEEMNERIRRNVGEADKAEAAWRRRREQAALA